MARAMLSRPNGRESMPPHSTQEFTFAATAGSNDDLVAGRQKRENKLLTSGQYNQKTIARYRGKDMAAGRVRTVLCQLKSAAVVAGGSGVTDAQLLDQYLTHHSQIAFESLLRRHGPMVLSVCRRVLENHHDAEDAFQATFLVLVRKGDSIVPRGMVGNWLYGVAYRTSMKARTMNAKRRVKERMAAELVGPTASADLAQCDLQRVLDQELNQLSDKYRAPLVLCDVEGKTRREAAGLIGCPEGTVATRLVKARALLAKALTRRGLALSGGGVALLLGQPAAAVPAPLLSSTMKAANAFAAGVAAAAGLVPAEVVALTEGVVKAMSMYKTKTILMVLFAAGLLTFAGLLPSALPQSPAPQSNDRQDRGVPLQRDSGTATSFLAVGKFYEFAPAFNRQSFQGKVMAVRGEHWVHVEIHDGVSGPEPTWVNLNHIVLIADATEGRNKFRPNQPDKK
jgi:RNA polymerase sigma factor (sigma-70 family)